MPALEVAIVAVLTGSAIAWLAFLTRQILQLTEAQATTAESLRNMVDLLARVTEQLSEIAREQEDAGEDRAIARYLQARAKAV